jgi:hypothetical protein
MQQKNLFDPTPWTPTKTPKPARKGRPEDLLDLIRSMQGLKFGCKPRIRWFAEQLGVCRRTIQRWLRRLSSEIQQVIRGWHRSATYRVVSPQNVTPETPPPNYSIPPPTTPKKAPQAARHLPERVKEALNRGAERIKVAKNPHAYRRAIIRAETDRHTTPKKHSHHNRSWTWADMRKGISEWIGEAV